LITGFGGMSDNTYSTVICKVAIWSLQTGNVYLQVKKEEGSPTIIILGMAIRTLSLKK